MGALVVAASYGLVIIALVVLAARVRRRGISAPILDVFDQMYRPSAHEARVEIQADEERTAPNETPDDDTRSVSAGAVGRSGQARAAAADTRPAGATPAGATPGAAGRLAVKREP